MYCRINLRKSEFLVDLHRFPRIALCSVVFCARIQFWQHFYGQNAYVLGTWLALLAAFGFFLVESQLPRIIKKLHHSVSIVCFLFTSLIAVVGVLDQLRGPMADEDFHEKLSVVFTAETAHFATAAQHRIDHLESDLQSSRCESNQPEVCLIIWKRLNSLRYSIDTSPFLKDLLEATAAMHQNAIAIDDEKICNCLREKCHRILPRPTDPTKLFALYRLLSNPLAPVTIQAILAILLFVVQ